MTAILYGLRYIKMKKIQTTEFERRAFIKEHGGDPFGLIADGIINLDYTLKE